MLVFWGIELIKICFLMTILKFLLVRDNMLNMISKAVQVGQHLFTSNVTTKLVLCLSKSNLQNPTLKMTCQMMKTESLWIQLHFGNLQELPERHSSIGLVILSYSILIQQHIISMLLYPYFLWTKIIPVLMRGEEFHCKDVTAARTLLLPMVYHVWKDDIFVIFL